MKTFVCLFFRSCDQEIHVQTNSDTLMSSCIEDTIYHERFCYDFMQCEHAPGINTPWAHCQIFDLNRMVSAVGSCYRKQAFTFAHVQCKDVVGIRIILEMSQVSRQAAPVDVCSFGTDREKTNVRLKTQYLTIDICKCTALPAGLN